MRAGALGLALAQLLAAAAWAGVGPEVRVVNGRYDTSLLTQNDPVLAEIFAGAEARSAGLAEAMRQQAEAWGTGFFDAGSVIASDPLDGVHFGEGAHGVLGLAMARKVAEL